MYRVRALKWGVGLLAALLALHWFFFEELLFAMLLFAIAFLMLLLLAIALVALWDLTGRGMKRLELHLRALAARVWEGLPVWFPSLHFVLIESRHALLLRPVVSRLIRARIQTWLRSFGDELARSRWLRLASRNH